MRPNDNSTSFDQHEYQLLNLQSYGQPLGSVSTQMLFDQRFRNASPDYICSNSSYDRHIAFVTFTPNNPRLHLPYPTLPYSRPFIQPFTSNTITRLLSLPHRRTVVHPVSHKHSQAFPPYGLLSVPTPPLHNRFPLTQRPFQA